MKKIITYIKRNKIKSSITLILLICYTFCLPSQLFDEPTSTVITDTNDELLGALIAKDGQWRFPKNNDIPEKFKTCIIQFEDEYFYSHPGFNPVSIYKALKLNIRSGKVKRGGSTLTQQVIRLSRNGKDRTYFEKLKELILATRLELRESKEEILALWASYAPFGGNVIGLDAASWRYFNRKPSDLSWAETATLAVLPNAPSLIYPGKNQEKLLEKRNRLLKKLLKNKIIDSLTYELSIAEELPQKPYPLPQVAPHLLQKVRKKYQGELVKVTIDKNIQDQANDILNKHYKNLKQNGIFNGAVLVLDIKTRKVLAYVGNTNTEKAHQKHVDIIDKPRSTGSILKPFLYTAMLDNGELLPNMLLPDVPTQIGSYQPENYVNEYSGAVSAKVALSRSLNIPAVKMLQKFGVQKFHHYLQAMSLKDISNNADRYGLSLILGGAESNLWDLCKNYAAFSSTLTNFNDNDGQYFSKELIDPIFIEKKAPDFGKLSKSKTLFDAASIYLTFESLKEVNRPGVDQNWQFFNSAKTIAWKTGTSFGFRDAWAIGVTKKYVVGVWVGNADGEGRPGLVGVKAAAPILFDVFDKLPNSEWFDAPLDAMDEINVCKKSGYRATNICSETRKELVQTAGLKTDACPYHILVHLDEKEEYQVNTSCEQLENITQKPWFILPPRMAYYYKEKNPFYTEVPTYKNSCTESFENTIDFIYPKETNAVYLPKDFNGKKNEMILKIAHSNSEALLFWYLDNRYIGTTKEIHDMAIQPTIGRHQITVMDQFGTEVSKKIEIKS